MKCRVMSVVVNNEGLPSFLFLDKVVNLRSLFLNSKRSYPMLGQFRRKALGVRGLNNHTLSPTSNGFPQALLLYSSACLFCDN